ncbi:MAG: DUF4402 domain-containing protein [Bacteroidales bacterium]|nr:DUF4402 domain-containing protein [Bacteroidales bacterium]
MYRNFISIVILIIMIPGNARAQATISAQVFAEIIEALTANETEQLNFGRFSPETNGGNIIISPNGTRSAQGSVILASGLHSPGRFSVTGVPNAAFIIQLPGSPAMLLHQGSNKTMLVEGWVSDPPAGSEGNLQPNGSQLISIGATLTVGPVEQNPVGLYAGTFQLTFAYN